MFFYRLFNPEPTELKKAQDMLKGSYKNELKKGKNEFCKR